MPKKWRALPVVLAALIISDTIAAGADTAAAAREEMVQIVQMEALMMSAETGVTELDPRVLDAMRRVPRHAFVPEPLREYAYRPHPLPVTRDQNIAAPFLIALMTHLAALEPDDVVYETGTGAGYHAAVLSELVDRVYSVEVIEPLAERAARILKELGYDNVFTRAGDGYFGWPENAPYDAIIVKEAIDHVPPPLLQQLKRGGRLVMPLGPARGPQYLTVVTKDEQGKVSERRVLPVRFSPLQGGERT